MPHDVGYTSVEADSQGLDDKIAPTQPVKTDTNTELLACTNDDSYPAMLCLDQKRDATVNSTKPLVKPNIYKVGESSLLNRMKTFMNQTSGSEPPVKPINFTLIEKDDSESDSGSGSDTDSETEGPCVEIRLAFTPDIATDDKTQSPLHGEDNEVTSDNIKLPGCEAGDSSLPPIIEEIN
ncbi:hypothetical protein EB796_020616 [Bugula neritina]|uniref:Uncharacterized protein n=1 Tax=Bugula neritina TaxID=10212 RepID=A0A7J7J5E5_BUGNE|nr:hypothetical protein EB796_020616 [Bugula neritina]